MTTWTRQSTERPRKFLARPPRTLPRRPSHWRASPPRRSKRSALRVCKKEKEDTRLNNNNTKKTRQKKKTREFWTLQFDSQELGAGFGVRAVARWPLEDLEAEVNLVKGVSRASICGDYSAINDAPGGPGACAGGVRVRGGGRRSRRSGGARRHLQRHCAHALRGGGGGEPRAVSALCFDERILAVGGDAAVLASARARASLSRSVLEKCAPT